MSEEFTFERLDALTIGVSPSNRSPTRRQAVTAFVIVVLFGIAGQLVASDENLDKGVPFAMAFEVDGMSCDMCASSATEALEKIRGVDNVQIDFDSKTGTIESSREIDRDEIRKALSTLGFEARFPGEEGIQRLSEEEKAPLDIAVASRGERIRLEEHLAPGKITIFDFWAEWCGPCHLLTPKLERLVQENDDVALRTIDLLSWESDVAKQSTDQFKLPGLPYVRVYDSDGRFAGYVVGNSIEKVFALIEKAR